MNVEEAVALCRALEHAPDIGKDDREAIGIVLAAVSVSGIAAGVPVDRAAHERLRRVNEAVDAAINMLRQAEAIQLGGACGPAMILLPIVAAVHHPATGEVTKLVTAGILKGLEHFRSKV